jgi:DNA-binding response OmpR family regulator
MAKPVQVLVVDDDRSILKFVSTNLIARGYTVVTASSGAEALDIIERQMPDLIILDIMMPRVDGLTVCRRVREFSTVPIIILSAWEQEDQKVQALDLGADDYLTKPFGVRELLARVRAVLRRAVPEEGPPTEATFQSGDLRVDFVRRRVTVAGNEVHLTPTEYALLRELARYPDRVLTHDMLLSQVWGPEYRGSSHYLHIYVGRLRRKLASTHGPEIVTEPGVGYLLKTPT